MPDRHSVLGPLGTEDIGEARRNELLRDHGTLWIGGPADLWVQPTGRVVPAHGVRRLPQPRGTAPGTCRR